MFPEKWLTNARSVSPAIGIGCAAQNSNGFDRSVCLFTASVAQELISFLSNPKGEPDKRVPAYHEAARFVAASTMQAFNEYPSLSCRLDTMSQGALCVGDQNGCTFRGRSAEMRPSCWYVPSPKVQMARAE
jgi:hypothetical protein